MTTNRFVIAAVLGTAGLLAAHLLDPTTAAAQSTTTGAIQGVIDDETSGEAIAGVTVIGDLAVVAGHADRDHRRERLLQDQRAAARRLPRDVLLPRAHRRARGTSTSASRRRRRCIQKMNTKAAESQGETINVKDTAPTIDPTSTTQGITIDKNYIKNIPVPGRTFDAALGAAAGSQSDGLGVSFSGSSLAREPVLRRRRQHDRPDVRHGRLAGHQRLHRGDRGHHRRLQRRVRPRHRRRRQRRHQDAARTSSRARSSATSRPASLTATARDARRSTRRRSS